MADSPRYIDVDRLMEEVSVEQVAAFYSVQLPELQRRGDEIRAKCFLACGFGQPTGNRAIAINAADPAKKWKCHQYGCDKSGNLASMCDLLAPGAHAGGRPRGERFKQIARDLLAMAGGSPIPAASSAQTLAEVNNRQDRGSTSAASNERREVNNDEAVVNLPLAQSPIEKARSLVNLDEKFVRGIAAMPPPASHYLRSRVFLSPEVQAKWRVGYLPRGKAGSDQSGGTMRGRIVYPILSERGEVLSWFGRDPEFEAKYEAWVAAGRRDREPEKFHFVKGFHRGLELFGQQWSRLKEPGFREALQEMGLVVVEGANDVIRLDTLGVPAVGLCSTFVTEEQAAKVARFAKSVAGNRVTLMLDLDAAGEAGTQKVLFALAKLGVNMRLGWSVGAMGEALAAKQPEELTHDEWRALHRELSCRD
jgi:hypothetical protein